jgi:hypothetical protein
MDLEDAGCQVRYLIRDRDGKYPALFDSVLADAGIGVVPNGILMPRMNSIMERWIQACRHELPPRRAPASPGHRERPTAAAAAQTDHRTRDPHAPTHPPTRSTRRTPSRIRACRLNSTDGLFGTRNVEHTAGESGLA